VSEEVILPPGFSKEQAERLLKEQPIIFSEMEVGYLKKIRVWKNFYKGKELYGIQTFYKEDETQDEWKFGKAINFPPELIDEILEGFTKMKAYIEGGDQ